MKRRSFQLLIFTFITISLFGCENTDKAKIFYINSYHKGYGSSDDVMDGIEEGLKDEADLKIAFLDSKRHSDPDFIKKRVKEILNQIQKFEPGVIIASDDNAVKYIIEPHFKNGPIPVVFCGVNWSADQYQLPREHVTGMLEVLPFVETVNVMKQSFPEINTLTVLSENSESERKNKIVMQPLFDELGLEVRFSLVSDFESWKTEFVKANETADLLYIPTNGAIKDWDEEQAISFVKENIKIPVITCDDFMMPYAVFGLTKVAKEQGEWAAKSAMRIISGESPSEIPISKNEQSQAWLNKNLIDRIGFQVPEDIKNYKTVN